MSLLTASPVNTNYSPKSTITAQADTVARAIPADIAAKAGRTAGEKSLGAWSRPAQG
jgi:hypothetical protein